MTNANKEIVELDGTTVQKDLIFKTDVVIVGSGPAGSAVAYGLSQAGLSCIVLEEGKHFKPENFSPDMMSAMATLYRDFGASLVLGKAPMPFLQAKALGGTSLVNGAISWRLPKDIFDGWLKKDPALGESLNWQLLSTKTDETEELLNIQPTDPKVAGLNNSLLAKGAEALGIEHRPISRNVKGCQGRGRCLQGCPGGNKMSADQALLPMAFTNGCRIFTSCQAEMVQSEQGRACGVVASTPAGGRITVKAGTVVLAASAIQTPLLLLKSGIKGGPVGDFFAGHPGVSLAGKFKEEVKLWHGATQGHEGIGLRKEGIKFEALGYGPGLVAARLKGFGKAFADDLAGLNHWANWGAAVKAEAFGSVRQGRGRPKVKMNLTKADMFKIRRGVQKMGEMMLAAGAEYVTPGINGWHDRVSDPKVMARLEDEASINAKDYAMAITHMFGTCRMSSDKKLGVVNARFEHHRLPGLYIADSSVFPSNTGVNPQTSIISMALICADNIKQAHKKEATK